MPKAYHHEASPHSIYLSAGSSRSDTNHLFCTCHHYCAQSLLLIAHPTKQCHNAQRCQPPFGQQARAWHAERTEGAGEGVGAPHKRSRMRLHMCPTLPSLRRTHRPCPSSHSKLCELSAQPWKHALSLSILTFQATRAKRTALKACTAPVHPHIPSNAS